MLSQPWIHSPKPVLMNQSVCFLFWFSLSRHTGFTFPQMASKRPFFGRQTGWKGTFFSLKMSSFLTDLTKGCSSHSPPLLPLSISWTWPWRRRWQVSGWRFPAWRSWAAATIRMSAMFWTSWSCRVRTVLSRCTPTGCPAAARSKLWVRSRFPAAWQRLQQPGFKRISLAWS